MAVLPECVEAAPAEHRGDIAVEDLELASVAPDYGFVLAVGAVGFVFGAVVAAVVAVAPGYGFVLAVEAVGFVFGAVAAAVVAVVPDYDFASAVGAAGCIFDKLY